MSDDALPINPLSARFRVPGSSGRQQLAAVLAAALSLRHEVAAALVLYGSVRVEGKNVRRPDMPVRGGERVTLSFSPPPALLPAIDVLFESRHLLVVNKPAGIPVQGTRRGSGSSLEEALAGFARGNERLHIVHRLDLPVSGLLVLARTREAAAALTNHFQQGRVRKLYLAAVNSADARLSLPAADAPPLTISTGLKWLSGKQRALVDEGGRPSTTIAATMAVTLPEVALCALRLVTGRTHQARVHLAFTGASIVGDGAYGWALAPGTTTGSGDRICLHATRLEFEDPWSGEQHCFVALPPDCFWQRAGVAPGDGFPEAMAAAFGSLVKVGGAATPR